MFSNAEVCKGLSLDMSLRFLREEARPGLMDIQDPKRHLTKRDLSGLELDNPSAGTHAGPDHSLSTNHRHRR